MSSFEHGRSVHSARAILAMALGLLVAASLLACRSPSASATRACAVRAPARPLLAAPNATALLALQEAELTDPNHVTNVGFGCAVAVSGDTALVSESAKPVPGVGGFGVVYVFTRSSSGWSQQAELSASDAASGFGSAVALSGDTALIGAEGNTVNGQATAGAAYVFTRSGASWSQQTEITDPTAHSNDYFGAHVALSGDTALVAAPNVLRGSQNGAAYVFTRSGASWSQQADLPVSASSPVLFASAVALSGETALVGAIGTNGGPGAACIFTRTGGVWTQQAELRDYSAYPDDQFGAAVALSGGTAIVGAPAPGWQIDQTCIGAAYVFTASGSSWSQAAKISDPGPGASSTDSFGSSVALSGDEALVGADGMTGDRASGAAFVFTGSGESWTQVARLTASDATALDRFGTSVALSGDIAFVCAPGANVGGVISNSAVYAELLDGTPPVTTASGLRSSAPADWQRTPSRFSLSASDGSTGSGVAATYYAIDGAPPKTYSGPFNIPDGPHTVAYWSVDQAGNVEAVHAGYVRLDTEAPEVRPRDLIIRAASSTKGKVLRLRLVIFDPPPGCGRATLNVVLVTRTGKRMGHVAKPAQPTLWQLVIAYRLPKTLKRGTYVIVCRATDAVGNVQAKATRAKLTVK